MTARQRRDLVWELSGAPETEPRPSTWVPATVPGTAQVDWLAGQGDPVDVYRNDLAARLAPLERYRWYYRARLPRSAKPANLVIQGVDYAYQVRVDGRPVLDAEGMYTSHAVPLAPGAEAVELVIEPPPMDVDPPVPGALWEWTRERRGQARRATRPLVSYGDDYQPRAVTAGPWQDIFVEERPDPCISSFAVYSSLSLDRSVGHIRIDVEVGGTAPEGSVVRGTMAPRDAREHSAFTIVEEWPARTGVHHVQVPAPRLWWPWELGEPALYELALEIVSDGVTLDAVNDQVAFRRVELVVHDGGWREEAPEDYPKSRIEPPHALVVNGRPLFVKGTCMTPPSLFPHEGAPALYDPLIETVRAMNFNLIKNSGGGMVHKEEFYRACDEAGIMVWQDFPLSCNEYPEDADYLNLLAAEARSIVRRLRRHPSVVVWCGGNELFTPWSRMTEQHQAVRLLNAITLELDPWTPFVATTPQQGATHGYYMFANPDASFTEGVSYVARARATAYMEVACPAPAAADLLRRLVPAAALFPPEDDPAWRLRSAWDAWDNRPDTWLCRGLTDRIAGPGGDLDDFVERAQRMQAALLQQVVEEARRQQPRCSAVCIWVLNEPWPNAANLSITSFGARPKQAVARLAAAGRSVLLSARLPRLTWAPGEQVNGELWLLDDWSVTESLDLVWWVELRDGRDRVVDSASGSARRRAPRPVAGQLALFTLCVPVDVAGRPPFALTVRCPDVPTLNSEYPLFVRANGVQEEGP